MRRHLQRWRPADPNPCGLEVVSCSFPDLRVQSMRAPVKKRSLGRHGCYRLGVLDTLKGHLESVVKLKGARHRDHPLVCARCDHLGSHDCLLGYNCLGIYLLLLPPTGIKHVILKSETIE